MALKTFGSRTFGALAFGALTLAGLSSAPAPAKAETFGGGGGRARYSAAVHTPQNRAEADTRRAQILAEDDMIVALIAATVAQEFLT